VPVITLPDGSQRSFERAISVAEVAQSIGAGLARAALAGRVDGKLVDTSFVIDRDAAVAIISIAQQASPNCSGQMEFLRPQL